MTIKEVVGLTGLKVRTEDFKVDLVESNVTEEMDSYDVLAMLNLLYLDIKKRSR